jgi:hypothetical protein
VTALAFFQSVVGVIAIWVNDFRYIFFPAPSMKVKALKSSSRFRITVLAERIAPNTPRRENQQA